jgi:hypothetical protein
VGTGDTIDGLTLASLGQPYENDFGAVAFVASFAGGSNWGIFAQNCLVVRVGQSIQGKTLLSVGKPVLNNAGQVGFLAYFSDGSEAIVRADPIDQTPPVTTAASSPSPNSYGWNNTNVTVQLNATDNPGGSGVLQIQFSLSGAQSMALQRVTGNAASITISAEGTTVLSYYATDNAGNQETTKTLTFKIDKTPPVISGMPSLGCTLRPPNQKLVPVATVTATDALSGLAPGSFHVSGTTNEPNGDPTNPEIVITPSGSGGFVIQLQADRLGTGTGRVYTLNATASDLAGNTATMTSTCTVPHDQGSNVSSD